MKSKIVLLGLAIVYLSISRASAQLVVTAPVLEVQSGLQTGLQRTMKRLEAAANKLIATGVDEQKLTKKFSLENMNQHKDWYDGLMKVSSVVRDYRRVRSIMSKQTQIISQYSQAIEILRRSPYITAVQLGAMTTMYGKLMGESANTVADLKTITSVKTLKMTDAERMEFIDQLDAKITDQLGLVSYFTQRNLMMLQTAQQLDQDRATLMSFMGKF